MRMRSARKKQEDKYIGSIELKYMEHYVQPEVWSRDFRLEPNLFPR
jgi:hypothetical protein